MNSLKSTRTRTRNHYDAQNLYFMKNKKEAIIQDSKLCQDKLEAIKNSLLRKKAEIESIKLEQEKLQKNLTKCESRAEILKISEDQLQNQKKLILLVNQEDVLLKELNSAHRALVEARLAEQSFDVLNSDLLLDEAFQLYETQSELKDQQRLLRESNATKNTKHVKSKHLKSLTTSFEVELEKKKKLQQNNEISSCNNSNNVSFKDSLKRIKKHMKKTSNSIREAKLREENLEEMRQSRQYSSLAFLKKKIDEQKDILWAEAELRRKKKEAKKQAELKIRQQLLNAGQNPYLYEKLIQLAEKEKAAEAQLLEQEQAMINKISTEIHTEELKKLKYTIHRKKWDTFWAKKVAEKKRIAVMKRKEFLANEHERQKKKTCYESKKTKNGKITMSSTTEDEYDESEEDEAEEQQEETTKLDPYSFDVLKIDTIIQKDLKKGQKKAAQNLNLGNGDEIKKLDQDLAINLNSARQSTTLNENQGSKSSKQSIPDANANMVLNEQPKSSRLLLNNNNTQQESFPPNHHDVYSFELLPEKEKQALNPNFKWTPDKIIFKGFEPGGIYKKKVSVTNVSLKRLKFHFKQLIDNNNNNNLTTKLSDLIQIEFEIPSPISPGLSHDFTVIFKPNQETVKDITNNIYGCLQFDSPNGAFEIEIECLQKTFLPKLLNHKPELHFHNAIVNSFHSKRLKLINAGAKAGLIDSITQVVNKSKSSYAYTTDQYLALESSTEEEEEAQEVKESKEAEEKKLKELFIRKESQLAKPKQSVMLNAPRESTLLKSSLSSSSTFDAKEEAKLWLEDIFKNVTESSFVGYVQECKRNMEPNEILNLKIHFHPNHIGDFVSNFKLMSNETDVEPINLDVEGYCIDFPVHSEPANTNFKICLTGLNYQQPISIINSSKYSGKIIAIIPQLLIDYVQVLPKEIQIYPNQSILVSIKFKPRRIIMEKPELKPHFFDPDTNILDFPVYFYLVDFPFQISDPIICTFQAILSSPSLEIHPKEIELGKCCSTETVRTMIEIRNTSLLPQTIGFIEVPQTITIQPNYGFTQILPSETMHFELLVSVTPSMEGPVYFQFKIQSLGLEEYTIKLNAVVTKQILTIAHSRLLFPATCAGSFSSATTEIFSTAAPTKTRGNLTSSFGTATSKFEFQIPSEVPIEIRPVIGIVEPGKSVKILVTFVATVKDSQVKEYYLENLKKQTAESKLKLQSELESINNSLHEHKRLLKSESKIRKKSKDLNLNEVVGEAEPSEKNLKTHKKKSKKHEEGIDGSITQDDTKVVNKKKLSIEIEPTSSSTSKKVNAKTSSLKKEGRRESNNNNKDKKRRKSSELHQVDSKKQEKRKSSARLGSFSQETYVSNLLRRKSSILKQLQKFDDVTNLSDSTTASLQLSLNPSEFRQAKKELMSHYSTSSSSYTIPCFVSDLNGNEEILFLNVKCPIQPPDLIILDDDNESNLSSKNKNNNVIDFGVVSVADKAIKTVPLYNVSQSSLHLKMDLINPYGPFIRVNAIRKIAPDHTFGLKLKFTPRAEGFFEESVEIIGGESRLLLILKGSAVRPEFLILPNKPDIYIGTIRVKTTAKYQFEIENNSNATLAFELELIEVGHYEGHEPIFTSQPASPAVTSRKTLSRASTAQSETPSAPPPSATKSNTRSKQKQRLVSTAPRKTVIKESEPKLVSPPAASKLSIIAPRSTVSHIQPYVEAATYEIDVEIGRKETFTLQQLIEHLELKKQNVFFQIVPQRLEVKPNSKETFVVHFIPMEAGRYFCTFQLSLFGEVVHEASVVGGGYDDRASKYENE